MFFFPWTVVFAGGMLAQTASFQIPAAPEATAEVRVLDEAEETSRQQGAGLSPSQQLPGRLRSAAKLPAQGVVSSYRFRHRIRRRARKEFERAAQAYRRHQVRESIGYLQKAVELDPGFVEAFNNLGTRWMEAQHPAEAAEAFRKALALDPATPVIRTNLAVALLWLQQPEEAERMARSALPLDQTDNSRRILRVALAAQGKSDPPVRKPQ